MENKEIRTKTKYRKIYTLFERDKNFKVINGVLNPRLEGIKNIKDFIVTEKIDGTNCGIVLTPEKEILIRKRSNIIKDDNEHHHYFEATKNIDFQKIKDFFIDSNSLITIFGEVCGDNIQKMGKEYGSIKHFRLFDVKVGDNFFDWRDLIKFSKATNIPLVKGEKFDGREILGYDWLKKLQIDNKKSYVEGYVVRSNPLLLNKFGLKMVFKIKLKDFDLQTKPK